MQLKEEKHLINRLLKVELEIKMSIESHVPDTMTLIRVLPSVAVVGQVQKVERSNRDGTSVDIYVKFLPVPGSIYFNLMRLCKQIKMLKGVKIIKVTKLGGRPVVFKGKTIVL